MLKRPKNSVLISEVLHLAADEYLAVDPDSAGELCSRYSCVAIDEAFDTLPMDVDINIIFSGLINLGLNPGGFFEFKDIPHGFERQAARYNWLKFAALLAEEQEAEQKKLGLKYWL